MHAVALQMLVHSGPGVFKVFGQKMPTIVGEIFHAIAVFFRLIAIIGTFLVLLFGRGAWLGSRLTVFIKMIFLVALGMIGIPSLTPKASQYTADVTRGTAVGSTGASLGMVIFLLVIFLGTVYLVFFKRAETMEGEA